MGMMSMPQAEAAVPTAPQGMLSGSNAAPQGDPSTSHGNFNGTVDVGGQQIQVQKGVAKVEGQPYFVSDNGAMVVDHQGNVLGYIADGKFAPMDAEHADKLRQAGYMK